MKFKSLCILAGVAPSLVATGVACAGFQGLAVSAKPNESGIAVCNVYAVFDNPGQDRLNAVVGLVANPLSITVVDGTFFQHPLGTDRAPNPALFQVFPDLRYDTFVTIGVKSFNPSNPGEPEGAPEDNTLLLGEWPGFGASTLMTDNGGWGVLGSDPQGDPFNPDFSSGGNGQVLIAQLATADGTRIMGTVLLELVSDGVVMQVPAGFDHVIGCSSNEECDDGDPCNGLEICDPDGNCVPGPITDCNGNGVEDACDIDDQTSPDCNSNGVPDECDIADGTSFDVNDNGIPDDCECIGDVDNDGTVGVTDFLLLLGNWGLCAP